MTAALGRALAGPAPAAAGLAAADPANTTWQRDLSTVQQHIDDLDDSAE
jgi:hypothetical protein